MKHIKRINIAILLMIAVIIGMIAAMASYHELNSIAWYWHILVFGLVFFVLVLVHELTHALAFLFQGIRIKAIYVLFISFIKKKKILVPTFNIHSLKLLGGLVVPDMPVINSEEEFLKVSKKFKISILAAPIVSVVVGILLFIVLVFLMIFNPGSKFNEIFITINLYSLIITLLVNISSSAEANGIYGDYKAYQRFNQEDEVFSYIGIENYFIEDSQAYIESKDFMHKKLIDILENNKNIPTLYYNQLMASYLYAVIFEKMERSQKIDNMVKLIPLSTLYKDEEGLALAYLISSFYYILGEVDRAMGVFEEIKKHQSKNINEKFRVYLERKQEYHFRLNDDLEFLNNKKNMYFGINVILEPVFHFKDQELKTNIRLKPGVIIPKIHLFQKLPRFVVSGSDVSNPPKPVKKISLFTYLRR